MNTFPVIRPARLDAFVSSASFRGVVRVGLALGLLLAAGTVAAKPEKVKVCHVSSDGKVNLLVVSPNAFHVGNTAHEFDGLFDYEPGDIGASGEGTEDSNGDGIDDGCEPPEGAECPCFDAEALEVVTFDNQNSSGSCDSGSNLPLSAAIQANSSTVEGLPGAYFANLSTGLCGTNVTGFTSGTDLELEACINLIAARCQEIGTPITDP